MKPHEESQLMSVFVFQLVVMSPDYNMGMQLQPSQDSETHGLGTRLMINAAWTN